MIASMNAKNIAILGYSAGRTLTYAAEFAVLIGLSKLAPVRNKRVWLKPEPLEVKRVRGLLAELLKQDSENIVRGVYPLAVLKPESPFKHWVRYTQIALDGFRFEKRRALGKTSQFARDSRGFLEGLPRYYQRNFHYQTDGYLSDRSARLWDHQVELTFAGTGDAMRRLIIPPLRKHLGAKALKNGGKGLRFLELGCGTGSATRFVRLAFPEAKIVAVDLSAPYLKFAARNLSRLGRVDFLQADAAALPFTPGQFDAVYSVFLFHELPENVRQSIVRESRRVLKRGGFLGAVDSVQLGDIPDTDRMLENFPKNYHEPFYRNYVQKPLEKLFKKERLKNIGKGTGFLSKVVWGKT